MQIRLQEFMTQIKNLVEKMDEMPVNLTPWHINTAFRCLFLKIEELEDEIRELKNKE